MREFFSTKTTTRLYIFAALIFLASACAPPGDLYTQRAAADAGIQATDVSAKRTQAAAFVPLQQTQTAMLIIASQTAAAIESQNKSATLARAEIEQQEQDRQATATIEVSQTAQAQRVTATAQSNAILLADAKARQVEAENRRNVAVIVGAPIGLVFALLAGRVGVSVVPQWASDVYNDRRQAKQRKNEIQAVKDDNGTLVILVFVPFAGPRGIWMPKEDAALVVQKWMDRQFDRPIQVNQPETVRLLPHPDKPKANPNAGLVKFLEDAATLSGPTATKIPSRQSFEDAKLCNSEAWSANVQRLKDANYVATEERKGTVILNGLTLKDIYENYTLPTPMMIDAPKEFPSTAKAQ